MVQLTINKGQYFESIYWPSVAGLIGEAHGSSKRS
jgi:hypothetical protein